MLKQLRVAADRGDDAAYVVGLVDRGHPDGQPRLVIPYGKDLPTPFKAVTALATDGAGQVAALVDGGDYGEGVVIFGPDGAVLRHATFKALGIGGRITSLVLDRSGGLILCDRRNDLLIRLN